MKLLPTTQNISRRSNQREYSSWGNGISVRKRKGLHYNTELYSDAASMTVGGDYRSATRVLSDEELWTVYIKCCDVRASVDSIVRRVATFDWMVVPKISPQDERYQELQKTCEIVSTFLQQPNRNGDTWQEIMTAMLTDALVMDAGVLELAYGKDGVLQELVPLRGSTIYPRIDEFGRVTEYTQNVFQEGSAFGIIKTSDEGKEFPTFKNEQILYLSLFKNTADPKGNPIIESIVNEVIAMLRANEHAMISLDADEIPPGILVLAGIAGKAAEEARADMQRLKGQDHKIRVMTTPDPTGIGAKWLELKRTPKDVSMVEIIDQIRRSIYRAFGVMPVEMGMTESIPRATAVVQMDVASSHLVTPILELLQGKINGQIIPSLIQDREITELIKFTFDRETRLTPKDQKDLAETHKLYVQNGIMTRNEVREILGLMPVDGANSLTVDVGGTPTDISEKEKTEMHEDKEEAEVDEKIGVEAEIDEKYEDAEESYFSIRAVGDVDPTNFPKQGEDKKVSLRNSNYPLFDRDFAERVKNEYPSIWKKGGNVIGNEQYARLTKVAEQNGEVQTETDEKAVRLREAWMARHLKDFRLAGVIAQIKWLGVGSRGEQYMKDLVNEEIKKLKDD